jgi:hypothetical protein
VYKLSWLLIKFLTEPTWCIEVIPGFTSTLKNTLIHFHFKYYTQIKSQYNKKRTLCHSVEVLNYHKLHLSKTYLIYLQYNKIE